MALKAGKSADYEVRYLDAVLDEEDGEPLLGEGLLKLGEWMAGYYLLRWARCCAACCR